MDIDDIGDAFHFDMASNLGRADAANGQGSATAEITRIAEAAHELQSDGDLTEAINTYLRAVPIGGAYGVMCFVYANLGICHHLQGNFEKAVEYQTNMLDLARTAGDRELLCQAYTNLGISKCALGEFEDAISNHQYALGVAQTEGLPTDQMRAHANLGNAYGSSGQYKLALAHHEQQKRLAEQLKDHEAIARANYNLESDANSMKHYAVANRYRKIKLDCKAGKMPLNKGFADHKQGHEVSTGWLTKHIGGDEAEKPDKFSQVKRWAVLRDNIFAYYAGVTSQERALRYIRVQDILSADPVFLGLQSETEDSPLSFRIHVSLPRERYFFFTCDSFREVNSWCDSLHLARGAVAHFTGNRDVIRDTNLAGAASDYFQAPGKFQSNNQQFKATSNLSSFEAPSGFSDNNVKNPLFQHDARIEDEEEELDIADLDLAFPDPEARKNTLQNAWLRQNSSQLRAIKSVETGNTTFPAHLLGTHLHKNKTSKVPSPSESEEACRALKLHPHPTVSENLTLNVDTNNVVVHNTTVRTGQESQLPFLEHSIQRLAGIQCFEDVVIVIEQEESIGTYTYTTYAYQCDDDSTARTVKSLIASRMMGNDAMKLRTAATLDEESSMMHTPLRGDVASTQDVPQDQDDSLLVVAAPPGNGYASFSRIEEQPEVTAVPAESYATFNKSYQSQGDESTELGYQDVQFQPSPAVSEEDIPDVVVLENGDAYTLPAGKNMEYIPIGGDEEQEEYLKVGRQSISAAGYDVPVVHALEPEEAYETVEHDTWIDGPTTVLDGNVPGEEMNTSSYLGYDDHSLEGTVPGEEIHVYGHVGSVDFSGAHPGEDLPVTEVSGTHELQGNVGGEGMTTEPSTATVQLDEDLGDLREALTFL